MEEPEGYVREGVAGVKLMNGRGNRVRVTQENKLMNRLRLKVYKRKRKTVTNDNYMYMYSVHQ